MKVFIPDVKNNVCTVDENGITPLMRCSDIEECFYMCDRLNKAGKDGAKRNSSKGTFEN